VNGIHQDDKSLGIDVYNLATSYTTNITSKPVFQSKKETITLTKNIENSDYGSI
jgi:hypothetical protein